MQLIFYFFILGAALRKPPPAAGGAVVEPGQRHEWQRPRPVFARPVCPSPRGCGDPAAEGEGGAPAAVPAPRWREL